MTYNYNDQNRLMETIKAKPDGSKEKIAYAYDPNGNQTAKTYEKTKKIDPANPPTASFGLFVYGQKNKNPRIDDIVKGTASYEYNKRNELVKSTTGEGTGEYKYNGDGLRCEKTVTQAGKETTTRQFYEYDKVVLELEKSGKFSSRNIYGLNLVSRTVGQEGSNPLYYMYNGHADVTALIDGANVMASYYYDAFGNVLEDNSQNVNNPVRYAGYQYDTESGLYYLNARHYDPNTARFMQEDTYRGDNSDPLSLNLYSYCNNNPVLYSDPTGHSASKDFDDDVKRLRDGNKDITITKGSNGGYVVERTPGGGGRGDLTGDNLRDRDRTPTPAPAAVVNKPAVAPELIDAMHNPNATITKINGQIVVSEDFSKPVAPTPTGQIVLNKDAVGILGDLVRTNGEKNVADALLGVKQEVTPDPVGKKDTSKVATTQQNIGLGSTVNIPSSTVNTPPSIQSISTSLGYNHGPLYRLDLNDSGNDYWAQRMNGPKVQGGEYKVAGLGTEIAIGGPCSGMSVDLLWLDENAFKASNSVDLNYKLPFIYLNVSCSPGTSDFKDAVDYGTKIALNRKFQMAPTLGGNAIAVLIDSSKEPETVSVRDLEGYSKGGSITIAHVNGQVSYSRDSNNYVTAVLGAGVSSADFNIARSDNYTKLIPKEISDAQAYEYLTRTVIKGIK